MRRRLLLITAFLSLMIAAAQGQDSGAPAGDTVADTNSPEARVLPTRAEDVEQSTEEQNTAQFNTQAPGPISGVYAPLIDASPERKRSMFVLHTRTFAFFDSNGYNATPSAGHEVQYSILPGAFVQKVSPRSDWSIDYSGGVAVDNLLPDPLYTQSLSSSLDYRIARHVRLTVGQTHIIADEPLNLLGQTDTSNLRTPGGLNPFVLTPTTRETMFSVAGDLTWLLSPHSSVTVSGGHSTRDYDHSGGQVLEGTTNTAINIYYTKQVSRRKRLGIAFDWQDFTFGSNLSETVARGVQLFSVINVSDSIELSGYGGPQQLHTNQPATGVVDTMLVFSGGGALNWRHSNLGIRIGYDDAVSDGGGLTGAVHIRSGNVDWLYALSRRSQIGVNFRAGGATELGTGAVPPTRYTSLSVAVVAKRQLLRNVDWTATYSYSSQDASSFPASIAHHHIETSITYSFARPWRSLQ